jgi:pyruvate/2-oxoglutarate dehydrogenase complex dihydrolipoamide dehydrogenase (E3) component
MVISWSLDTAGGGKTLAARFGRLGRRVAMVDQSDRMYGGSCVNAGCVPTKALVHEAETRRASDDPRRWYTGAVSKVGDGLRCWQNEQKRVV